MFQAFNLIPLLNVRENIELPFTIAGGPEGGTASGSGVMELSS